MNSSAGTRIIARIRKEHTPNRRRSVFPGHTRIGLVDAGVGRPRGRGRLNRRVSDGVMMMPCETFARPVPRLTLPRLVLFSLFSAPIFPVLLLLHPSAARRAWEATRGRGGSPKTCSGLSIDATAFSSASFSICSDKVLTLGSMATSWSALHLGWAGTISVAAALVMGCTAADLSCSAAGEGVCDVIIVRGYGEGRLSALDLIRRGPNSDGRGW